MWINSAYGRLWNRMDFYENVVFLILRLLLNLTDIPFLTQCHSALLFYKVHIIKRNRKIFMLLKYFLRQI